MFIYLYLTQTESNCINRKVLITCNYRFTTCVFSLPHKSRREKTSWQQEDKTKSTKSDIIEGLKMDSKVHFNLNRDCGLNNTNQKCNKCKFTTHSMGLLRIHDKETQVFIVPLTNYRLNRRQTLSL